MRLFRRTEVAHHDTDVSIAAGADLAIVVVGFTKEDEGEFIDVGTSEAMMTMFPPAPAPPAEESELPPAALPPGPSRNRSPSRIRRRSPPAAIGARSDWRPMTRP